ncbi:MAG: RNA-binding transcriptional accessory protein [Lachnospiraceae bacterium]|nr:RNA-binding transcriptional accessory protein [Lachnospiraceae bacterium]
MADIVKIIADELKIKTSQVEATIGLIDEGKTIPFIARYRKEVTGSLNDEVLRNLGERLTYLRNLEERKDAVLASIEEQGKLTAELKAAIDSAMTQAAVEDLYRPYKPKKRTRAMIAKEKGLEPLAREIFAQKVTVPLANLAEGYLSDKEGLEVKTVEDALAGASDILAEEVADEAEIRQAIRKFVFEHGSIATALKDAEKDVRQVYENYYEFSEPVAKMPGHRVLAVNRGEAEKVLSVKVVAPEEQIIKVLEKKFIKGQNAYTESFMQEMLADSYKRLIFPAVEREIRNMTWETAEDGAIHVFSQNLRQLLMQPPIEGQTVLGWDPAFRTGCKLCIVDPTGKVLYTTVIFPTEPQKKIAESKAIVKDLVKKYGITLISLGNGTASRESEQVIVEIIKELSGEGTSLKYVIVNEAGASVYSASKLATEEFPNFDVGQRSSASMARRLQDPLSELVKIDPAAIGVGQYQHDMNQKKLSDSLSGVVEDCVNSVGVDANTASASLLMYVSGINKTLAKSIVEYREENGAFKSRKDLLKVPKLGPKAYELCAGFMRIKGGKEALDATSVHPESYDATKAFMEKKGITAADIASGGVRNLEVSSAEIRSLAAELGIGEITLSDIVKELKKPARDPREEMPKPILKSDVLDLKDLKEGMVLKGTVRNVIDFGAFIDIGVHQDGLVHISQMSDKYIKHPLEVVSIGDVVEVKVLSVDMAKKRIALTMK